MKIDCYVISEAVKLYNKDNNTSYGVHVVESDDSGINADNYYSCVNWKNGFDDDGYGIPCDAPLDLDGLLKYKSDVEKIADRSNAIESRIMEYPSIGDQLDALYHAGVFPSEMADKIKKVKEKYPIRT
jgi:hypothetical protein